MSRPRPLGINPKIAIAAVALGGALLVYSRRTTDGAIRDRAVALAKTIAFVDWGDPRFDEVVNGSYEPGGKSSTCGFVVSWLLWKLGLRTNVNRNDPAHGLVYVNGKNIERVRLHPSFVRAGGTRRPKPGDAYFMSDGPPETEHVGIVESWPDDAHVITLDGGQSGPKGQAIRRVARTFDGKKLHRVGAYDAQGELHPDGFGAPRDLVGWIDLEDAARRDGVAV